MVKKLDNRLKLKYAAVGIMMIAVNLAKETNVSATSDPDYSFVISSDWHTCQQINAEYEEVYAFETASFYINICQKDDVYFYSGEAKQSDRQNGNTAPLNSIFMTAEPLDNYRGFQAKNGNVSYLVILPFAATSQSSTLNPGEAILTIKRNGQLVSVESSLSKYCSHPQAIAFEQVNLNFHGFNQLLTVVQEPKPQRQSVSSTAENLLSAETFKSNSNFEFYRVDGKLHRLTTCN
ncbi:MAG: hypothetical protein AAGE84_16870 [Cyanobacteria bacterium P01_G01_bin.39]